MSNDDHITIYCRVRPTNEIGNKKCLAVSQASTIILNTKPETKSFAFDYTADENVTQEEFFQRVGLPLLENSCFQGYNSTIMCYGQTGSGKSHTIFGSSDIEGTGISNQGLVPRSLDHLWSYLKENESKGLIFLAKCFFYEIYQERVFDLLTDFSNSSLSSTSSGLQVREDSRNGVFVEGLTEETVHSPEDATKILTLGYQNRHVGETNMNRESSRSHVIFGLTLETSYPPDESGVRRKRVSKFTLVDLAGSERQKDTNATGERLKEAGQINRSLSTLGNVINALSEKTTRHIQYRDSKLTFLLRESLGGNSRTVLIATISPTEPCLAETLSTLKFAQRAKMIRTMAVVNEETTGSVMALQREVTTLKALLAAQQQQQPGPGVTITGSLSLPTTSSSSSSSSSASVLAPSFVPLPPLFPPPAQSELSSQLLLRCQTIDELRTRAENQNQSLLKRLEQTEYQMQNMKMKIKMREAEILRLKKNNSYSGSISSSSGSLKSGIGQGMTSFPPTPMMTPAKSNLGGGGVPSSNFFPHLDGGEGTDSIQLESLRESLRLEYEGRIAELQTELVKNRKAVQEWERRWAALAGGGIGGNPPPPPYNNSASPFFATFWSEAQEISFHHELLELVRQREEAEKHLQRKFDALTEQRFEECVGMSVEQAQFYSQSCETLQGQLKEAEQVSQTLNHSLSIAQQQIIDMEAKVEERRREMERSLMEKDHQISDLTQTLSIAKQEIKDKEEEVSQAIHHSLRTEDDIRSELKRKENEHREKVNSLVKENTSLLRRYRELDLTLSEVTSDLERKSQFLQEIQSQHEAQKVHWEGEKEGLSQQLTVLTLEYSQSLESMKHLTQRIQDLEGEIKLGKEEIQRQQNEFQQVSRETSKLQFERDAAREDVEDLYTQNETLLAERLEQIQMITNLETTVNEKNEKISSLESLVQEKLSELVTLETQGQERASEISTLESMVHEKNDINFRLESRVKELSDIVSTLESTVSEKDHEISNVGSKVQTLENDLSTLKENLESSSSQLLILSSENSTLSHSISLLSSEHSLLQLQSQKTEQELTQELSKIRDSQSQLTQHLEAYSLQMTDLQFELDELNESHSTLSVQYNEKLQEINCLKEELSRSQCAMNQLREEIHLLKGEGDALRDERERERKHWDEERGRVNDMEKLKEQERDIERLTEKEKRDQLEEMLKIALNEGMQLKENNTKEKDRSIELEATLSLLSAENSQLSSLLSSSQIELERVKEELSGLPSLQAQLRAHVDTHSQLTQELHGLRFEVNSLKDAEGRRGSALKVAKEALKIAQEQVISLTERIENLKTEGERWAQEMEKEKLKENVEKEEKMKESQREETERMTMREEEWEVKKTILDQEMKERQEELEEKFEMILSLSSQMKEMEKEWMREREESWLRDRKGREKEEEAEKRERSLRNRIRELMEEMKSKLPSSSPTTSPHHKKDEGRKRKCVEKDEGGKRKPEGEVGGGKENVDSPPLLNFDDQKENAKLRFIPPSSVLRHEGAKTRTPLSSLSPFTTASFNTSLNIPSPPTNDCPSPLDLKLTSTTSEGVITRSKAQKLPPTSSSNSLKIDPSIQNQQHQHQYQHNHLEI